MKNQQYGAVLGVMLGLMAQAVWMPKLVSAQVNAIEIAQSRSQQDLAEALQLNERAMQLYQQGQYSEAIPLAERSLAIYEEQLGANHPDTATSLNTLALLYESMGRYQEAEPLYVRSLAISEEQLGAKHPQTVTSLNNLVQLGVNTKTIKQPRLYPCMST
jgi:tetratricopeptide (TPR) repeat protein